MVSPQYCAIFICNAEFLLLSDEVELEMILFGWNCQCYRTHNPLASKCIGGFWGICRRVNSRVLEFRKQSLCKTDLLWKKTPVNDNKIWWNEKVSLNDTIKIYHFFSRKIEIWKSMRLLEGLSRDTVSPIQAITSVFLLSIHGEWFLSSNWLPVVFMLNLHHYPSDDCYDTRTTINTLAASRNRLTETMAAITWSCWTLQFSPLVLNRKHYRRKKFRCLTNGMFLSCGVVGVVVLLAVQRSATLRFFELWRFRMAEFDQVDVVREETTPVRSLFSTLCLPSILWSRTLRLMKKQKTKE